MKIVTILKIFNYLHNDCNIDSIKCTIVRDEGVYKTPYEKKKKFMMLTIGSLMK